MNAEMPQFVKLNGANNKLQRIYRKRTPTGGCCHVSLANPQLNSPTVVTSMDKDDEVKSQACFC